MFGDETGERMRVMLRMEEEEEEIVSLVEKLSGSVQEKRAAVKQLRERARGEESVRLAVADAGGIEALLPLLQSVDSDMQENAITTLLNLSVNPQVRVRITQTEGALDGILELLSTGQSAEAKENSAATVFSLLIVEDYREVVGKHPLAIPALLSLLRTAPTHRGRKDAIKGLFHLSLHDANKPRVVAEGGVQLLVSTMLQRRSALVDESLSVLAVLASCEEGAMAVMNAAILPTLVELLCTGAPRTRENALAVLLALCQSGDVQMMNRVSFYNNRIVSTLCSLLVIGSDRAKRKAKELMSILITSDSSLSNQSTPSYMSDPYYRSASVGFSHSNPRARP